MITSVFYLCWNMLERDEIEHCYVMYYVFGIMQFDLHHPNFWWSSWVGCIRVNDISFPSSCQYTQISFSRRLLWTHVCIVFENLLLGSSAWVWHQTEDVFKHYLCHLLRRSKPILSLSFLSWKDDNSLLNCRVTVRIQGELCEMQSQCLAHNDHLANELIFVRLNY